MKKASSYSKPNSSKVNVMGQDVMVDPNKGKVLKTAEDQSKEVTYTSNDEDESYEPDFQSEFEGPFTPEEQ